ncbi:MAG: Gfo/Idh/MocA family oxidoreductase [Bacteroidaceae bacterium]|nr:Gfo/Idh/MocA family oxidoreductase [Bacteroidaceae bacterium]
MSEKISRREFLQRGTAAAIGLTVVPNTVLGKSHAHIAPSDKLNIAGVGVGGMGNANLRNMERTDNIVALCDVDFDYAKDAFNRHPKAQKYRDFRRMYDEMGKSIDAVLVATPDHTHAIVAANAIAMGKHVYVQKPLTHTVYESRLLTNLAKKYKVATQMGNQGASSEDSDLVCEWIWNGEIGEVTRVDCATDRPLWPQGLNTPTEKMPIPWGLGGPEGWDLFLGPAKYRPYNRAYHPWDWRGWWDYGTGALGDMACHIMQVAFKSLNLLYPIRAEGCSTPLFPDCAPNAQHVKLTYPARKKFYKVNMPQVEIHWYDGGLLPEFPKKWEAGKSLMREGGGVTIFHGTKDTLVCGCYGQKPFLVSGRVPNAPKIERRVGMSHEQDWIRACKESPENRVLTKSDFSFSGPFNEMVVMGVLAVRLQGLNRPLDWDGLNMRFTNIGENEELNLKQTEMKVIDGDPKMTTIDHKVNAMAYAQELIKHTYRDGWTLPEMPTF